MDEIWILLLRYRKYPDEHWGPLNSMYEPTREAAELRVRQLVESGYEADSLRIGHFVVAHELRGTEGSE